MKPEEIDSGNRIIAHFMGAVYDRISIGSTLFRYFFYRGKLFEYRQEVAIERHHSGFWVVG